MKARSRLIHPGLFYNEELADLGHLYQLLFVGLSTIADREGRLKDRPRTIKSALFPHDTTGFDMNECLNNLARAGFILRYTADEIDCIFIPTFDRYQTVHTREAASELPPLEIGEIKPTEAEKEDPAQQKKRERATKKKKAMADLDATIPYEKIVSYLNSVTGRNFQYTTPLYRNKIRALWNHGIRFEDFVYVIQVKFLDWKDSKMRKHLNPETLFGNKFDKYRNQEMPDLMDDLPEGLQENAKAVNDYMRGKYGVEGTTTERQLDIKPALGIDECTEQKVDDPND